MAKVHEWVHGAWTKALADEGLPTTRTPHSSSNDQVSAPFLYLTVRANELWCVTNCRMDFPL